MQAISGVRILEKESNKRGDLFGRLMADLFFALGYDEVRLNVHKAGREVDIEARHRTEPRRVFAECKATKKQTGGDAINKFVGTLDAERRKTPDVETVGYFISLSGFKETAIEQEKDAGGDRVVLLDGEQVIEELINGRIIVSPKQAMEQAGRCAARVSAELVADPTCELMAHEMGWIWAAYYTQEKEVTHFALIHADGEAIAAPLAELVIAADEAVGGSLHSLSCLASPGKGLGWKSQIDQARRKYFDYLASECGAITLEGLPADQEVGMRRLKLESIFVPLFLEEVGGDRERLSPAAGADGSAVEWAPVVELTVETGAGIDTSSQDQQLVRRPTRRPVGEVLSEHSRLAILGGPGSGKTTLLKRLAVAYAFPNRSRLVDDNLPEGTWLPLFIRCRHLGDLARSSIGAILLTIPRRAEIERLAEPFIHLAYTALRSGNALLLVDGLDEISDEGARVSFVKQLCVFLARYPGASIVVTSREAGFRIVGGALSAHCRHYRVADFNEDDIRRLTVAWHEEVVGHAPEVRIEAENLAETICGSDRVRQLARNPLLLTALLLVKRWVGQLPTRRSVLYAKAIEVLLMTWNVEGYQPIDQEEAIPKLAFVAFAMMRDRVQRISSRRLKELLFLAREQMPEILGYASISVSEFIKRVELRSSLILLSGHEVEQGTLRAMYEFRHLTFQEYLAARAVVDGYYPDRTDEDTLLTVLKPHLGDEGWKEVVPLAAVLSGRGVRPLIEHLIELCRKGPQTYTIFPPVTPAALLAQCILDEVQISPELLEEALEWCARRRAADGIDIVAVFRGKYGAVLRSVVRGAYGACTTDPFNVGGVLGSIGLERLNWAGPADLTPELVSEIADLLHDEDPLTTAEAALAAMKVAHSSCGGRAKQLTDHDRRLLEPIGQELIPLLRSDQPAVCHAGCWALAWRAEIGAWNPQYTPRVLTRLLELWKGSDLPGLRDVASWTIAALPLVDREVVALPEPDLELIGFIQDQSSVEERYYAQAALIVGFYLRTPWTDQELADLAASQHEQIELTFSYMESLLNALGEPAKKQLRALRSK